MADKIAIFILTFVLIFASATSSNSSSFERDIFSENIPQPILKEPVTDKVDLSGKKELVFRWSPHEGDISQRRYYDFRLYQGYQMIEANLILQNNVSPNQRQFAVNADIFKLNQIYTWSLRQKYRSGKSQRSTSSFTVINK